MILSHLPLSSNSESHNALYRFQIESLKSIDEIIQAYAILGGIPHYLKQFDSSISIAENIKNNILTKGSVLYSEVEFLMRQELRETSIYNAIIEAIALGNTKLNDIYQKTQIDKSKLSVYLKNLLDLGFFYSFGYDLTSTKQKQAKIRNSKQMNINEYPIQNTKNNLRNILEFQNGIPKYLI